MRMATFDPWVREEGVTFALILRALDSASIEHDIESQILHMN